MLQLPFTKEDYFALQRLNMRRFGFPEDAIEKMIANWYPLIGTRAVLAELYHRGWIADEEDVIAWINATFPERKHELVDNLDRLILLEPAFEHLLEWLVTHQRGRLSPVVEELIKSGFESIDEVLEVAAQRYGCAAKPKQES